MKCRIIYGGLMTIDNGSDDMPGEVVQELFAKELIAQINATRDMSAEEGQARKILRELSKEYAAKSEKLSELDMEKHDLDFGLNLAEEAQYKKLTEEMSELEARMRDARQRLLAATTKPGLEDCLTLRDGRCVQITYKGRELLHTLGARLESSADKEYGDFIKEMDWLKGNFGDRAKRARAILKIISPRMKKHEEIFLRSAAIGLSGISEPEAKELAKEFRQNAEYNVLHFRSDSDLLGAEVLTIMNHLKPGTRWNASALRELRDRLQKINCAKGVLNKEIERTATVIFSTHPDTWPKIMETMDMIDSRRPRLGLLSTGILALECMEGQDIDQVLARYDAFYKIVEEEGKGKEGSNSDATAAAAFLASSSKAQEELVNRFRAVSMILDDLFIERMDTAASLITIMSPGIMETLDNIRMAGAEIMKAKLSLSGVENFSLGLKMVLQAGAHVSGAIGAGQALPGFSDLSANTLQMSSAVRGNGVPYLVFHRSLVHNRAIHHHRFHPVHSHYVYG